MKLNNEIGKWLEAGIINQETANRIRAYYASQANDSSSRLSLAFGILGALIVGLGVILIIAHNWADLPKSAKTLLAFAPLLLGQGMGLFVLLKKNDHAVWRESAAVFIFFTVAACLSLISQIYQIQGDLSIFMLTWLLLCLPLIYIFRSPAVSLLYILGISYYAGVKSYWGDHSAPSFNYWFMLLAVIPFYIKLIQSRPGSNFTVFHHWFVPLSITFALGSLANEHSQLIFMAYIILFAIFHLFSYSTFLDKLSLIKNGYKLIGLLGTILLAIALSFDWYWDDLKNNPDHWYTVWSSVEFISVLVLGLAAFYLLINRSKHSGIKALNPVAGFFILFIILFFLAPYTLLPKWIINMYIIFIAVHSLIRGSRQNHLGIINFGLLLVTILVFCRFFYTEISFITRGILFIALGIGFFLANYRLLKSRKSTHDQNA